MSRPQHTQGKGNILKYNEESTKQITFYGQVESPEYLDSIIGGQGGSHANVKARFGKESAAFVQL